MSKPSRTSTISKHYNAVADGYSKQYDSTLLRNLDRPYPANYFRLETLLEVCKRNGVKSALEVGVGDGTPLAAVAALGVDVWGFDLADQMVERAKQNIANLEGGRPSQIFVADIQETDSYKHVVPQAGFDALIAMGVMPHVESDTVVLENMSELLKVDGTLFVEFRNKLFSLFTFNRKTLEFVMDELLVNVPQGIRDHVHKDLSSRLRMDMPPVREKVADSEAPGYDAILSKFHNPLETVETFRTLGYDDVQLHWYHYHPAMPYLENEDPEGYREASLSMEHEGSGWRGYFLASAFVIEAIKR